MELARNTPSLDSKGFSSRLQRYFNNGPTSIRLSSQPRMLNQTSPNLAPQISTRRTKFGGQYISWRGAEGRLPFISGRASKGHKAPRKVSRGTCKCHILALITSFCSLPLPEREGTGGTPLSPAGAAKEGSRWNKFLILSSSSFISPHIPH